MQNVYSSMEQEYFTPREIAKQLRVDYTTVKHEDDIVDEAALNALILEEVGLNT